jgi:acetyl esterase/lipase
VHAGEVEVLRPQIERFVEKARSAGVDVTYETLQDMVHVGHMFLKFSEIASDAIARIGQFVSSHSS